MFLVPPKARFSATARGKGGGGGGGSTDPFFANVSVLLHFDGSDGSTTFTDSSLNNFTYARTGTPTISTAQSRFGGSSLLLPGGTNYISPTVPTAPLTMDADFTVESFVRSTSTAGQIVCGSDTGGFNVQIFRLNQTTTGAVSCFLSGASLQTASGLFSINTWHHLALARAGTTARLFIDGILRASATSNASFPIPSIGAVFGLGVVGNIDEFRITKGVARYTADFTPPTAPFPNS